MTHDTAAKDWQSQIAKTPLPSGKPASEGISASLQAFLKTAAMGPMKGSALEEAAADLVQAWNHADEKPCD